jgi:tetratricopeptide (TPR) repeat protein
MLKELGRLEEAEASYRKAIAIKPDYAEAHSNLGIVLNELGKLEETEASYRKAVSLKTDNEATQYNLGIWYCEQGKYKQAIELLLRSKNFKNSQSYLLKCWYFLNEQSLFYELLDSLTSQGITDAIIGSFGCRAAIKFGIEKANPFCSSPLNYVFKTDLSKKYDFKGKFVKPTLSILDDTKFNNRSQNLLTNGLQTSGNLFALENILIYEIKKIIELEIENYRLYFKDSKEGLIQNWPNAYSLYGWIIRMKNGGALRPHMHENGWISGSIYINVPPKLNINDGNLVVCIEDDALLSEGQDNKKNIIDVSTGSLCLFPASLLHYTIPFESDEERIVLAFDVIPKKKEVL